jgi:hypothetical protein
LAFVPEGQGDVPWHRITDFAITDALTARINYSTGNLMLTATHFDIAGVEQRPTLARTYNSLDAPWGKVSQRWWQQYERYLQLLDGEAVLYDVNGTLIKVTDRNNGTITVTQHDGDGEHKGFKLTETRSGRSRKLPTSWSRNSGGRGRYSFDRHDDPSPGVKKVKFSPQLHQWACSA